MNIEDKIYVAGHNGMVGSAIVRNLRMAGFDNIVGKSSSDLDLRDARATEAYLRSEKPDYVFLAAAKVGGILANSRYKGDFLYDNLMIQASVIQASKLAGVKKLVFMGSSCIYPKFASQPIKEEYLLTGALEPTNKPYAVAKIAGIEMCQAYREQYGCNFIALMPTNLYGPGDHYDLQNSHVLPALIRKIHTAKKEQNPEVVIWGSGSPRREFLHVDDLADASVFLMKNYNESEIINIGTGKDISIMELAQLIQKIIGYDGEIIKDTSKPDGTPRKLLDVSRLSRLGWSARIALEDGIRSVYQDLEDASWY